MVKRSRIGTSSTLADTDVINYVTPPWQSCSAPLTNGPNPVVIEQSSGSKCGQFSRVFSVTSPESRGVAGNGCDRTGGFLEQCFYCSGRIFEDMEVYMYSEHAFCTSLCRESQIKVDKGKEKQTAKRKVLD
ncbi:hypothetical protein POM88_029246 [Heracleum sosnowskyi]|uniref:FLZ-type domain-containing protein n=1 Tax=Heracleum sosnowskyi TaxID=360622 RepID=A0AAD8MIA7_9APIA|nr:hypothetical protein POM88_029246 [Heracleum sosnowskyi]